MNDFAKKLNRQERQALGEWAVNEANYPGKATTFVSAFQSMLGMMVGASQIIVDAGPKDGSPLNKDGTEKWTDDMIHDLATAFHQLNLARATYGK